jgi:ribosomal protein L37AE/L43A
VAVVNKAHRPKPLGGELVLSKTLAGKMKSRAAKKGGPFAELGLTLANVLILAKESVWLNTHVGREVPPVRLAPGDEPKLHVGEQTITSSDEESERCPVCGSSDFTVNEEGLIVCRACGTVIRQALSNELGIYEVHGETFDKSDAVMKKTIHAYTLRDWYSCLDAYGLPYDKIQLLKYELEEAFRKAVHEWGKSEETRVYLPTLYDAVCYLVLEKHGYARGEEDLERVRVAVRRSEPWTIRFRITPGWRAYAERANVVKRLIDALKAKRVV